jgi:tRNA wybutosine-synthesizing protein 3
MALFDERKKRLLGGLQSDEPDLSPKGKPDDEILELISFINAQDDYVTTSSCSGRVVVFLDANKSLQGEEAKGRWLMNRHSRFEPQLEGETLDRLLATFFAGIPFVRQSAVESHRLVTLKFEPLVFTYRMCFLTSRSFMSYVEI